MREPFRDAAKRFRRVWKVLASEEFGRSSRRREAFPKSSEAPRAVAKHFRRVRKVLAPSRSVSEEFGRSSRHREDLPRCVETVLRCREDLPRCVETVLRCREDLPRCAETVSRYRGDLPKSSEACPLPNPAPRYPFCCFWNIMKKELVTKETGRFGCSLRGYIYYLLFMLLACGGAFIWQFFLPHLGGQFTSWGDALGWQREIALWNIGLIIAIIVALRRRRLETLRLMTLQCSVLCWCLGLNHLVALCSDFSWDYGIHVMGVLEVMLLGGVWGFVLLLRKPGGIAVNNKD